MNGPSSRQKLAELTSSIGAGILGVGIGTLVATPLRGFEVIIVAVGLVFHLWGMLDKHRSESGEQPWWSKATYWLCWVALFALVIAIIARQ